MNKIFLLFIGLALLTSIKLSAGATLKMDHTGAVCIERSTFIMNQLTQLISKDYMDPFCEERSGIVSLTSFEVIDQGYGCPFGHQFEYHISGECYIP